MPLSIRTRLGSYEILAPIGAGGMGEVYKARDTKLERDVAIKVLPQATGDCANARATDGGTDPTRRSWVSNPAAEKLAVLTGLQEKSAPARTSVRQLYRVPCPRRRTV